MSDKNKILLIVNIPPPYGGGEILAKYLYDNVKENHKYDIIATSRKKSNKSTQGKFSLTNVFNGLNLIIMVLFKVLIKKPRKVYFLIPKQFNPFLQTAILIQIFSIFKIPMLGELAGSNFTFLENNNIKRKFGLYYLRKLTELRVLGKSIKENLEFYNICETIVIENGIYIPEDIEARDFNKFSLNLLYVGAINFSKGIKNLIECLPFLIKNNIHFNLDIMGEWSNYDEKNEIEQIISNFSLEKYITFHGLITSSEKWLLYQSSDILVHPTYWDGQPLVILEAMGYGLPIITTKVGAIPDTVKANFNGILIEENTPENLSKSVEFFFKNPSFLKTVSDNNIRTYNEKYTVKEYLLRIKNWLEN